MILELQLLNGKRIIKNISPELIYNLEQRSHRKWSFAMHFPWIRCEVKPYIKFKYQDVYPGAGPSFRTWRDSTLKLDCSIACFMSMLKLKYTSWAESNINSMIANGE